MSLTNWLIASGAAVLLVLLLVAGLVSMLAKDEERREAGHRLFLVLFGVVNVVVEILKKIFGKGNT